MLVLGLPPRVAALREGHGRLVFRLASDCAPLFGVCVFFGCLRRRRLGDRWRIARLGRVRRVLLSCPAGHNKGPGVSKITAPWNGSAALACLGSWRHYPGVSEIRGRGAVNNAEPSTVRPLARDLRVLIGWPFPLGFGLDGRLLLERRGRVYV